MIALEEGVHSFYSYPSKSPRGAKLDPRKWTLTLTQPAYLVKGNLVCGPVDRRRRHDSEYNNLAGEYTILYEGKVMNLITSGEFRFEPSDLDGR